MPGKTWTLERFRNEGSYRRSCILITAAHLDLFAWIGKGQKTAADLASHFGGKRDNWEIFLDALCGIGLLQKHGRKYANTRSSSPDLSRRGATFLLPEYDAWKIWGGLADVLLSAKRPTIQKPFFSSHSKANRLLRALDLDGQEIAPRLIQKLPLSRSETLLDIGGGLGAFSIAFCRHYPGLEATIIEHPRIVPLVQRAVIVAGLVKRVRVMGLDLARRPALPRGFDTVFLSNIIHSRGVDENRSLLAEIRRCLEPKGQLIVRDVFMTRDRTAPEWAALFSISLLLHTPRGRCYTLDEILGWLRTAGFHRIRGPFRSSDLAFDPDAVLIARKS
jgi:SAM-dependent methyltransferase